MPSPPSHQAHDFTASPRASRRADANAERRLHRQAEILERIHESVIEFDLNGVVLHWNAGAQSLFGHEAAVAIGQPISALAWPQNFVPSLERVMELVLRDGKHEIEVRGPARSGEARCVRHRFFALHDTAGQPDSIVAYSQDVTASNRIEHELRKSQAHLVASQRIARVGSWELDLAALDDLDVNPLRWSDECFRVFGYEPGEVDVSNELFWKCVHPDDRIRVQEAVRTAIENNAIYEVDHRIILRDGSTRHILERGELVDDPFTGKPARIIGTAQDITERKRADEALRNREELYRRLVEGVRLISWEFDPVAKQFVFVSGHAEEILGYPLQAWHEPHFWYDHLHPDDRDRAVEFSRQQVSAAADHEYEYRMVRADGSFVWFKDITTVMQREGKAARLHGVLIDITSFRRIEEAVQISEQRFRAILDNSPAGIYMKGLDGRYIEMNRQAQIWTGLSREQIIGKTDQELFPKSVADTFAGPDQVVLTTGSILQHEITVPHVNGNHVHLDLKFPLLGADGKPYGVCGISTDITERTRAQEALRNSIELQRLTLNELDHRVRNNLASLAALVDISARDKTSVRDFAQSIKDRVQAMSAVHSLLSRGHWLAVNLRSLIDSLVPADLRDAVIVQGDDILITPRQVTALGMVVQELVANSLKYGSLRNPAGRVDICWTVKGASDNRSLILELTWREQGGPPISRPPRPSHGTDLVRGFVRSELRGKVNLTYPRDGALHSFELNLDVVKESVSPSA